MPIPTDPAVVRKRLRVQAGIERAFSVFVEQMETWWPATHHIGDRPFQAIFVEPREGGRWYERDIDGKQCDWGRVLAWDPPRRVCFSWHVVPTDPKADWKFDPDISRASEVEVRFTAEGPNATVVELEHRELERHGANYEQLRALFDGPGAWSSILEAFSSKFEPGEPQP